MILQEFFPRTGTLHQIENQRNNALDHLYPKVNGFRLNYVISPRIESSQSDLSSNSLDRQVLRHIRSQSDLIITTGLTARTENLRSSLFAPLLILTKSDKELAFPALQEDSIHPVYVTQKLGTQYPNSKALAIGINNAPITDFASAFCTANSFTFSALETGKTIAKEFAKSGLLAEIDLTVTMVKERSKAEALATDFVRHLNVASMPMLQLLNFEQTWLFRFGAPLAKS